MLYISALCLWLWLWYFYSQISPLDPSMPLYLIYHEPLYYFLRTCQTNSGSIDIPSSHMSPFILNPIQVTKLTEAKSLRAPSHYALWRGPVRRSISAPLRSLIFCLKHTYPRSGLGKLSTWKLETTRSLCLFPVPGLYFLNIWYYRIVAELTVGKQTIRERHPLGGSDVSNFQCPMRTTVHGRGVH